MTSTTSVQDNSWLWVFLAWLVALALSGVQAQESTVILGEVTVSSGNAGSLPTRSILTSVDVMGADRILYGSNFGGSDAVRHDLTHGLKLSDEDLDKIRWKNACELLHLDPAKIGKPAEVKKAA